MSHRWELSGVYQQTPEVSVFLYDSQWSKYVISHDDGQISIFTFVSFCCWDELFHLIDFQTNSSLCPHCSPLCCRVRPSRLPVPAGRDERPCSRVHHAARLRPHQRRRPRRLRAQRPHLTPGVPSPPPQTPQRLGAAQRHRQPVLTGAPTQPRWHPAAQHPGLRALAPSPPP